MVRGIPTDAGTGLVPTLRVDTTAGSEPRPSFAEIVAYLRRETLA